MCRFPIEPSTPGTKTTPGLYRIRPILSLFSGGSALYCHLSLINMTPLLSRLFPTLALFNPWTPVTLTEVTQGSRPTHVEKHARLEEVGLGLILTTQ